VAATVVDSRRIQLKTGGLADLVWRTPPSDDHLGRDGKNGVAYNTIVSRGTAEGAGA